MASASTEEAINAAVNTLASALSNPNTNMRDRSASVLEVGKKDERGDCCNLSDLAVGSCHPNSWIDYGEPWNIDENGNQLVASNWSRLSKILEWMPIVNFIYYAFFQRSTRTGICMVTADSVVEIANNVGVIAALLYTVVTALPGAITWDELDIVDYHFKSVSKEVWTGDGGLGGTYTANGDSTDHSAFTGPGTDYPDIYIGKYGCQFSEDYEPWQPMSVRLGNAMSISATWLASSFFLAVLLIISVSSLTRVKRDVTGTEMEIPEDALEAWYWWARFHLIFMLGCLVLGVVSTLLTLSDTYYLKFPQPWLEKLCYDNGWRPVFQFENGTETRDGSAADAGEAGASNWEPRDEMPNAAKYAGGRFVAYQSSTWRGWTKTITIGETVTDIEHLDPGRENGQSLWIIGGFLAIGCLILGYAQACADSNAKNYFQRLDKEKMQGVPLDQLIKERRDRAKTVGKRRGKRSVIRRDNKPTRNSTTTSTHNNNNFGFDETTAALQQQGQQPIRVTIPINGNAVSQRSMSEPAVMRMGFQADGDDNEYI